MPFVISKAATAAAIAVSTGAVEVPVDRVEVLTNTTQEIFYQEVCYNNNCYLEPRPTFHRTTKYRVYFTHNGSQKVVDMNEPPGKKIVIE